MSDRDLIASLKAFLQNAFPGIDIRIHRHVDPLGGGEIYFTHEKFRGLYPFQRYHYLMLEIPEEFFLANLEGMAWRELAPGETLDDLEFPDAETIEAIAPHVMSAMEQAGLVERLDRAMTPPPPAAPVECLGNFDEAKKIMAGLDLAAKDIDDALHVYMTQGAVCDCMLLQIFAPQSETAKRAANKARPGE